MCIFNYFVIHTEAQLSNLALPSSRENLKPCSQYVKIVSRYVIYLFICKIHFEDAALYE